MPIESFILIITFVPIGIAGWILGIYIRKKVFEKKYLRIHLSKKEWMEDMDLYIQENLDSKDNKESKNPSKPTHSPMDSSSFFSMVHKTRSNPQSYPINPSYCCSQKSEQKQVE